MHFFSFRVTTLEMKCCKQYLFRIETTFIQWDICIVFIICLVWQKNKLFQTYGFQDFFPPQLRNFIIKKINCITTSNYNFTLMQCYTLSSLFCCCLQSHNSIIPNFNNSKFSLSMLVIFNFVGDNELKIVWNLFINLCLKVIFKIHVTIPYSNDIR